MKSLILLSVCVAHTLAATMTPLSYTKLPYDVISNTPRYGLFRDAARKAAYHTVDRILYVASSNNQKWLHMIDMNNPANPSILYTHQFTDPLDGVITDVAACSDTIAVTLTRSDKISEGHVELFIPYNRIDQNFPLRGRITVGSYPKSAEFNSDCSRLIVASEGRPGLDSAGNFVDPEGQIHIIIRNDNGFPIEVAMDMSQFNNMAGDYVNQGVRYVYRGDHLNGIFNTFSQDLEPEAIAISSDDRHAYVSLQENNAIVKVDIINLRFDGLYGIPVKNWTSFDMDGSDRNQAANLRRHRVYSLKQPGALAYVNVNGAGQLITADTGKMKTLTANLNGVDYTDGMRCRVANNNDLVDRITIDPTLLSECGDDLLLGRTFISIEDGQNLNDLIEDVYTFGGRGISMWDATTLAEVYDSGDDFERQASLLYPATFNGDCSNARSTPGQQSDSLSDDMGPEPSCLAVGSINTTNILIAGTKSGMIYVFSVDGNGARFLKLHREGDTNDSWENLYNIGRSGDGRISDIGIINAQDSATGETLVYAIGEATGSVSVYQLTDVV